MGTKLSLNYRIISGPLGNVGIRTRIDDLKGEKLPFELMYFKETPKEILKFLAKEYLVTEYLDINPTKSHSPRFGDMSQISTFYYKKHLISNNGFSIQNSNLEGVTINNKFHKKVDLSFLPKEKQEEDEKRIISLIKTYLIRTDTFPEHFYLNRRTGMSECTEKTTTTNYLEKRKIEKDELKEKQLEQIIDYAQIILDKPNFSLKDLEKLIQNKSVAV